MAFRVIAVSSRVSPFFTEEVATSMLMTSAPSRLAATSKRGAGAGRVLEEQVDDGAARQQVAPLVDRPVLVECSFRKGRAGPKWFQATDLRCRASGATSARPRVSLSLKRDVNHAPADARKPLHWGAQVDNTHLGAQTDARGPLGRQEIGPDRVVMGDDLRRREVRPIGRGVTVRGHDRRPAARQRRRAPWCRRSSRSRSR